MADVTVTREEPEPVLAFDAEDAAYAWLEEHYADYDQGDFDGDDVVNGYCAGVAAERERCAGIADNTQIPARRHASGNIDMAWNDACRDIATAIRGSENDG